MAIASKYYIQLHGRYYIFQNQQNGLIVDFNNSTEAATQILRLIENDYFRAGIVAASKKTVQSYRVENMVKQYEDLFSKMLVS